MAWTDLTLQTLPLFSPQPPVAAPRAPDGVKRAARAGGRVDAAILDWCRRHVGQVATEVELWHAVSQVKPVAPDTTRRRRDALEAQGYIETVDEGPGKFRVIRATAGAAIPAAIHSGIFSGQQ